MLILDILVVTIHKLIFAAQTQLTFVTLPNQARMNRKRNLPLYISKSLLGKLFVIN